MTVEYMYDGDDLRTRKTVRSSKDEYAAKVTNYLYDRQYVILETDVSDNVAVRYVRGINYIARIDGADKLSYYLFNGHGDVVQTVTENGTVENNYDYDIFGSPILTVEMYANAIRYSGEFYDEEVGLYYLRARYYDPYIGRFISQDSYWGGDNNPLSLNLYTYANNDPIQYVDPTGHSALGAALPIGAGAAVADGPLPFGDAAAVIIIGGAAAWDLGTHIYDKLHSSNQPNISSTPQAATQAPSISVPQVPLDIPDTAMSVRAERSEPQVIVTVPVPVPTVTQEQSKPVTSTPTRPINNDYSLNQDGTYTVKWGDTLSKISSVTGVSVATLAGLNNIQNISKIREGQTLTLFTPVEVDTAPLVDVFPTVEEQKPTVGSWPIVEQKPTVGGLPVVEEKLIVGGFPIIGSGLDIETFPISKEGLAILLASLGVDKADSVGWKVSDPINAPTRDGKYPSWSAVQSRYWKNKAASAEAGEYSIEDMMRMAAGNAPLHPVYGVPMELHHIAGRKIADPHSIFNLEEVWPWEHADKDPYRHYKGPQPEDEGSKPSNSFIPYDSSSGSKGGLIWNRYGEIIGYNSYGGSYTDYSDEATAIHGGSHRENIAWTTDSGSSDTSSNYDDDYCLCDGVAYSDGPKYSEPIELIPIE